MTTEIVKSHVYRDNAGRVRIEWYCENRCGGRSEIAYLLDPVAYLFTILLPEQKTAYPETVVHSSGAGFQVALPGAGLALPMRKWKEQTQAIGVRVIEEIEIQGTRTVQTSDEYPSLVVTWEAWVCQTLGLTLEVKASGPSWDHTVKLLNLNFHEPDLALFAIPPDYAIS